MELAICVDFLSSQCLKERRCADYHCLTTYQWQWYHKKRWESFIPDENETLEKKYGSLNNPSCAITGYVEVVAVNVSNHYRVSIGHKTGSENYVNVFTEVAFNMMT